VEMMNQSLGTCPNFGVHFKHRAIVRTIVKMQVIPNIKMEHTYPPAANAIRPGT